MAYIHYDYKHMYDPTMDEQPIDMQYNCTGSETSLITCPPVPISANSCKTSAVAGVICYKETSKL
jgi:hypothetical protein